MAKLIVVNNSKCKECGQPTGWNWRIEVKFGLNTVTMSYNFSYKAKDSTINGGMGFADKYGIEIKEVDYRSRK